MENREGDTIDTLRQKGVKAIGYGDDGEVKFIELYPSVENHDTLGMEELSGLITGEPDPDDGNKKKSFNSMLDALSHSS